jgi:hypothetical protein
MNLKKANDALLPVKEQERLGIFDKAYFLRATLQTKYLLDSSTAKGPHQI